MIDGSIATASSLPLAKRAAVMKSAQRVARRNPHVTIDDALTKRAMKGKPVLFINEHEKARVNALAEEKARDWAAKRSLKSGKLVQPESIQLSDMPNHGVNNIHLWTSRGLDPESHERKGDEVAEVKSTQGARAGSSAAGDSTAGANASKDTEDSTVKKMHKNGTFNRSERARFKYKLEELT
jgi:hypothetical protein